ncbi:MAG: two-component system, OmpR family, response regulator ArlR [Thermosediminibacterales bacterium]|nr:two-component system, OmpR family, response regulator ArlR [Thermosediminibacterales bacterium]
MELKEKPIRVLIIEDEKGIARLMELELEHEGYKVAIAHDGIKGLEMALAQNWDIILLDLLLPGLDGLEVCRRIRRQSDTPIIMITAKDGTGDKIAGLDTGADDYITKPFAIEELLARIRALLRRSRMNSLHYSRVNSPQNEVLKVGDLVLNLASREVLKSGRKVELTKREFDLLAFFMQNPEIVLSRDTLLERVWGYEFSGDTNIVDVYVRYLRSKIDEPFGSSMIQTVRGVGYMLTKQ